MFLKRPWPIALLLLSCCGRGLISSENAPSSDPDLADSGADDADSEDSHGSDETSTSDADPPRLAYRFPYDVVDAAYSRALDRVVIAASDGSLHFFEPHSHDDVAIAIPGGMPTAVSVAPDGLHAAVAVGSSIVYVDLVARSVVGVYATDQTLHDIVLAPTRAYGLPAANDSAALAIVDLASGAVSYFTDDSNSFYFSRGTLSNDGKTLVVVTATDPGALVSVDVSSSPPVETAQRSSDMHDPCLQAWFSRDDARLYTACGAVFRADLTYAGSLDGQTTQPTGEGASIADVDVWSADGSVVVLGWNPSAVQVHDPVTFAQRGQVLLPYLGGLPPNGLNVFHDRAGTSTFALVNVWLSNPPSFGLMSL